MEITSKIKVLVTGANGQLGSELRSLETVYPLVQFLFTDVDDLNITSKDEVLAFMAEHKPDFIINCAAYTAVDKAEDDEDNAYILNALAPKYLSEAANIVDARLVHISTDYVFNGEAYTPYTESFPTSPNSAYGRTKLKGEEFVLQSGVGMVIRTAWLYSSYGRNFIKTIAQRGKESDFLRVVYDQVGTPTWANDLAQAIMTVVLKGKEYFIPEVFHYTNEGVCSWYDLALDIIWYYGLICKVSPILSSEYPTPAKRPPFSVLNKSKIKERYGVVIPHWRDSLKRCLSENTH